MDHKTRAGADHRSSTQDSVSALEDLNRECIADDVADGTGISDCGTCAHDSSGDGGIRSVDGDKTSWIERNAAIDVRSILLSPNTTDAGAVSIG